MIWETRSVFRKQARDIVPLNKQINLADYTNGFRWQNPLIHFGLRSLQNTHELKSLNLTKEINPNDNNLITLRANANRLRHNYLDSNTRFNGGEVIKFGCREILFNNPHITYKTKCNGFWFHYAKRPGCKSWSVEVDGVTIANSDSLGSSGDIIWHDNYSKPTVEHTITIRVVKFSDYNPPSYREEEQTIFSVRNFATLEAENVNLEGQAIFFVTEGGI